MFGAHKPNAPYMKFDLGYGAVASQVQFCPFEDVLGVGHALGFSSLLVPGAGEANPDFYYANPHETDRHRKERVVGQLLDKLPPDTISMDIQIPGVNEARLV
uniref:U3 small nucleolar RNA-associated protein 7 n=1 Tax=Lygus hesperus TaxID=30085 RepID=A0A0A9VTL8_LYGHE